MKKYRNNIFLFSDYKHSAKVDKPFLTENPTLIMIKRNNYATQRDIGFHFINFFILDEILVTP